MGVWVENYILHSQLIVVPLCVCVYVCPCVCVCVTIPITYSTCLAESTSTQINSRTVIFLSICLWLHPHAAGIFPNPLYIDNRL